MVWTLMWCKKCNFCILIFIHTYNLKEVGTLMILKGVKVSCSDNFPSIGTRYNFLKKKILFNVFLLHCLNKCFMFIFIYCTHYWQLSN
ncbi:hypothetical protein GDO86_007738 [Hymenochirus boettgeri]|uniref:Uncharacterized protein n=1 Tax=Hymenochirus boettgeri TaxID=247094 RepID=A0A8T2IXU0_9PIPI|nr:hypothetical protein GDO86_007738 [Hymenochirus boettgeri]